MTAMRKFTASFLVIESQRQEREARQLRDYALMIAEDADRRDQERKRQAAAERRETARAAEAERAARRRAKEAADKAAGNAAYLARLVRQAEAQARDQAQRAERERSILQRAVYGWQV